jgi:hypothetical protein
MKRPIVQRPADRLSNGSLTGPAMSDEKRDVLLTLGLQLNGDLPAERPEVLQNDTFNDQFRSLSMAPCPIDYRVQDIFLPMLFFEFSRMKASSFNFEYLIDKLQVNSVLLRVILEQISLLYRSSHPGTLPT